MSTTGGRVTAKAKTWSTRRVRAWNVKPGDVVEVARKVRGKGWVTGPKTVEAVIVSHAWPGEIELHFRHWHMGYHTPRNSLVRVRRAE